MLAAGESILLYLLLFFFLTRVPSFRLVNGAAENVLSRREVCTMPLSLSLLLYIYIYMYIFFTCVPDRRLVIDSVDNVLFARNLCCVFFVFILFPVYQIEGQSAMILPYSLHKEVLRCAVCFFFFLTVYQIEGQSAMILPYSLSKEVPRCAVCLLALPTDLIGG